jgi:rhodanese-related sulfurtransferase
MRRPRPEENPSGGVPELGLSRWNLFTIFSLNKERLVKNALVSILALVSVAAAVQAQPKPISPRAARDLLSAAGNTLLLDVRTREEFVEVRIPGAVLLPFDAIDAASAARVVGPKDRTVVVYCRTGRRSAVAASTLASLGYRNVYDLGGIGAWPYGTVRGE